jgi:hypothetical protein
MFFFSAKNQKPKHKQKQNKTMADAAVLRKKFEMAAKEIMTKVSVLSKKLEIAAKEMEKDSETIAKRMEIVEEKEAKWEQLRLKLQQNAAKAKKKIKLDVGGKLFATSKENLLRFEGSYFHAMLASGQWEPDAEDGAYFIDMDPEGFDRILSYLRTGELSFECLNSHEIKQLRKSMDYLQIPLPKSVFLTWDPEFCGEKLVLFNENRTVTRTEGGLYYGVLGSVACEKFRVRIDATGSDCAVDIGFAPKDKFQCNSVNYNKCGWYFYGKNGNLYSQAGDYHKRYYGKRLEVGNVVTCIFNKTAEEISFEVDGKPLGVAFENVDCDKDLFPAIESYDENQQLTLVEYLQMPERDDEEEEEQCQCLWAKRRKLNN